MVPAYTSPPHLIAQLSQQIVLAQIAPQLVVTQVQKLRGLLLVKLVLFQGLFQQVDFKFLYFLLEIEGTDISQL